MSVAILMMTIEVVLLIMFCPLAIKVKSHISLGRENCFVELFVLSIKVLHLKVALEKGRFVALVNGKKIKKKEDIDILSVLKRVINVFRKEQIEIVPRILAYIGSDDAKNGAILCALFGIFSECYPSNNAQKFDAQLNFETRLTILQAIKVLIAGKQSAKTKCFNK